MDDMMQSQDVMAHFRAMTSSAEQVQPAENVEISQPEEMVDLYRVMKTSMIDNYLDKPEEGKPYNPDNIPCVSGETFLTTDEQGNDVRREGKNSYQGYQRGEKVLHFFTELESAARYIQDFQRKEFNADCSIVKFNFSKELVEKGSSVGFYEHQDGAEKSNIDEIVIPLKDYDPHKNFSKVLDLKEYKHLIPGGAAALDPDMMDYGGFKFF